MSAAVKRLKTKFRGLTNSHAEDQLELFLDNPEAPTALKANVAYLPTARKGPFAPIGPLPWVIPVQRESPVDWDQPVDPESFSDDEIIQLMEAVLASSLRTVASQRQTRRPRLEAAAWFLIEGEDDWGMSFHQVCETLGYDKHVIRHGVSALCKEEGLL